MAPDVAPIERLEDLALAVDPPAIEAEFARIWRETAGAGFDESSIRLRVVNLVALAGAEAERARFDEVTGMMSRRHPCRAILALTDPARHDLAASISAHCWRALGGSRHVCSEEVALLGGTQHARQLASAVLALLVPDVPLASWFMGDVLTHGPLASALLDEADRMIFDSGRAQDLLRCFDTVLRVREEQDVAPADLAWLRLSGWRALVAQLFDDPAHAPELPRLVSLTIEGAPGASEPLLLAGWLLSRLDYTPADVTSARGELRATLYSGPRAVSLRVTQQAVAPISALRLESERARFSIAWHSDSGHLHVEAAVGDVPPARRVVGPAPADDATMIALALDGDADGPAYPEALEAIRGLLG